MPDDWTSALTNLSDLERVWELAGKMKGPRKPGDPYETHDTQAGAEDAIKAMVGDPDLTRALEELMRKKGRKPEVMPAPTPEPTPAPPAAPTEPWPASTDTRLSKPWSMGEEARGAVAQDPLDPGTKPGLMGGGDLMAGSELLNYYNPAEEKAKTRAKNAMEKRRLQAEMTGEAVPGLSYEETLTQERIKVEKEVEEGKARRATQGMTIGDVISGAAPPKVGGEFVFPPGDMSKSPEFQRLKAEADKATEGQIVAEIPDTEQLGGKNPKDTPLPWEKKGIRMGPGGQTLTQEQYDKRFPGKVEKPGDIRRLAAQNKLDQLRNLRSIAEGGMEFGNMAVAGDYVPGQTPRASLGRPQLATGIRGEIERISGEEDLYLKSQLKREEQAELSGLKRDEARVAAELDRLGMPNNMTTWQATEMLKERKDWLNGDTHSKANEALAAVRAGLESLKDMDGEAPAGQAQVLGARQLLQAYGEGSRMSEQDINQILLSPQFAGMYDRAYRFLTGRTTPMTVKLYKLMLNRLGKATKEHFRNVRRSRATSFSSSTGIPVDVILDSYGGISGEEGVPRAAPKGLQIRVVKDGKERWVLETDEEYWRGIGWNRDA
jgi:hypothetical protein